MLETLTALAVLSLTMSAIFDAYTQGLRGAAKSESNVMAVNLARTLLTEALSRPQLKSGKRGGEINPFSWEVSVSVVEEVQSEDRGSKIKWGMYRVTVVVANGDKRIANLNALKMGLMSEK